LHLSKAHSQSTASIASSCGHPWIVWAGVDAKSGGLHVRVTLDYTAVAYQLQSISTLANGYRDVVCARPVAMHSLASLLGSLLNHCECLLVATQYVYLLS
jgi:hypothetical protein